MCAPIWRRSARAPHGRKLPSFRDFRVASRSHTAKKRPVCPASMIIGFMLREGRDICLSDLTAPNIGITNKERFHGIFLNLPTDQFTRSLAA